MLSQLSTSGNGGVLSGFSSSRALADEPACTVAVLGSRGEGCRKVVSLGRAVLVPVLGLQPRKCHIPCASEVAWKDHVSHRLWPIVKLLELNPDHQTTSHGRIHIWEKFNYKTMMKLEQCQKCHLCPVSWLSGYKAIGATVWMTQSSNNIWIPASGGPVLR
nr:uncharacterized protein LOC106025074 isoform X2 [Cavia porcellus]